jgi:bile acid-coenzyme A ligase
MSSAPTLEGTTIGGELLRLADESPLRPALTCGGVSLTRSELMTRVRRLAASFTEHGVGLGGLVTVGLPNSVEFIEALLATWWVGATPQPISHRLPSVERRAILELARPVLGVGVPADEMGGCPALTGDDVRALCDANAAREQGPPLLSPIWRVATSGGSTGRPKLIVSHAPASAEGLGAFGDLLALRSGECVLVPGPLAHSAPFVIAAVSLLRGSHLVLVDRFDATETLELVERHRVDWLYLVPTMMQRIWRLPPDVRLSWDVSSLRVVFHMAAPCPAWLKEAWIGWVGADTVRELYGGTEAQALTTITGTEWLAHRGSVGRPVLGEIEARDDDGRRLRPGEAGELWLRRGAGLPPAYRYIGAEPRAAADGWSSLGDIGYLDEDGYVYLTDRRADLILVGGSNVYPAELEAALDEHPAVRSSCVVGLPDDDLGHVPHAIIELAEPVDDTALLAHLRERLAPYKLPRSIERVDHPLRDDAGKVRRSALRAARLPGGGT